MSSISIDHVAARRILASAWDRIDDASVLAPARVVPWLESVIDASDVTFKYLLVTGLLAKCVNPLIHPRVIQVASTLQHSYDARSLCHDVIVGFEKTKGDLWGLSNEPYLNKPARHPEHDKANRQLRNKKLAAMLHDALEFAHSASREDLFAMLVHTLRLSKRRAASQPVANVQVETSYRRIVEFVRTFLQETNGGSRLVAVAGAFISLLSEGFAVTVYPPNYADKFAKTAGDIEVRQGNVLVSAYECKQRPTTLDDVKHGIKKAKQTGLLEYCFVCSAGFAEDQEEVIRQAVVAEGESLDVILIDIRDACKEWAAALNPIRRRKFGETVVTLLRERMHRAKVAAKAAALWNSLE